MKSFYASVECVDRKWDPFEKNLVVADPERTEKTICLAVSPAMKALGVPGRCRVFEIPEGIEYFMAKPRMRLYMEVSAKIVSIYLRFVSAADLHVYSIDECFIDLTPYLSLYKTSAKALVDRMRAAVYEETGITATAGIGPNLFLAKVALDITAKHCKDGIGVLDEESFKQHIWHHRPITDIWQIGRGIATRLARFGIRDLEGVAHADIDLLYREFGVNAEYLIDHAWGLEPCTIAEIKAYEPESTSFGNGQVLPCDYTFDEARMVLREMVDETALELVDKQVVASSVHLYIGYKKDDGEKRFPRKQQSDFERAHQGGQRHTWRIAHERKPQAWLFDQFLQRAPAHIRRAVLSARAARFAHSAHQHQLRKPRVRRICHAHALQRHRSRGRRTRTTGRAACDKAEIRQGRGHARYFVQGKSTRT